MVKVFLSLHCVTHIFMLSLLAGKLTQILPLSFCVTNIFHTWQELFVFVPPSSTLTPFANILGGILCLCYGYFVVSVMIENFLIPRLKGEEQKYLIWLMLKIAFLFFFVAIVMIK